MEQSNSVEIEACRSLAKQFGASEVIVILVDLHGGKVRGLAYGRTQFLHRRARELGDIALDAVISALEGN